MVGVAEHIGLGEKAQVALAVLLHLCIVVPLAVTLNIWIDEASALQSASAGVLHAARRAISFELQPPLYFVLLAAWRELDQSLFFARLPSVVATAATVAASAGLVRRYMPTISIGAFAVVVAVNPVTLYAAVEARPYALSMLLSAMLMRFFHDGYLIGGPSTAAARRKYVVTAIAALYTQHFLGFLLAGGFFALLVIRRGADLRRYLADMFVAFVVFLPLAVATALQVSTLVGTSLQPVSLMDSARTVWGGAWRVLLPSASVAGFDELTTAVSRWSLPVLLVWFALVRRWPSWKAQAMIAYAGTVGVLLALAGTRFGVEFLAPRHMTNLALPVLITGPLLLEHLSSRRGVALWSVVAIVLSASWALDSYSPPTKPGDWIRVSTYIQAREAPSEPILVFRGEYVLDFGHHYAGRNQLIPLPAKMPDERYDPRTQALDSATQISAALSGRLGTSGRFWLVTRGAETFRGVDPHPEILEDFVDSHCDVISDKKFFGTRVRQLRMTPGGLSSPGPEPSTPTETADR